MYEQNGKFDSNDAFQYMKDVESGKINPTDEFLKYYGDGDIEKGYNEVIKDINDTTTATIVLKEGYGAGFKTIIKKIPSTSIILGNKPIRIRYEQEDFTEYFEGNEDVINSYNRFTDYLKENSSVENLSSEEELYE